MAGAGHVRPRPLLELRHLPARRRRL